MNLRSVGAVAAGVLFIIVVTTLVDVVLHAAGVYAMNQPLSNGLAALATSYRIVISVAGGWLTARLAPQSPMKHALILGIVGTILGLVGVVVTWKQDLGPKWYPIALMLLAVPQCWAGGKLYERRNAP